MKFKFLLLIIIIVFSNIVFADSNKNIEIASKSVVTLKSNDTLGSGFFISSDGYLLTNKHVVGDKAQLKVLFNDKEYDGKVVKKDDKFDVALVKVDSLNHIPFLVLGDSDKISDTEDVFAIGSPQGLEKTTTKGIISNKARNIENVKYIQIDAVINPGSSGGPLLNDEGMVLGINTMIDAETKDYGFALPVNLAIPMLDTENIAYSSVAFEEIGENNKEVKNEEANNDNNVPKKIENIKNNKVYLIGSAVVILLIIGGIVFAVLKLNKKKKKKLLPKKEDYSDINISFGETQEKPKDNYDDIDIELH